MIKPSCNNVDGIMTLILSFGYDNPAVSIFNKKTVATPEAEKVLALIAK